MFFGKMGYFPAQRHDCFAVSAVLRHPPSSFGALHDIWAARRENCLHLRFDALKECHILAMLPQLETRREFVVGAAATWDVGK